MDGICETCVYCWWLGKLPDQADDMLWVKCGNPEMRIEAEVESQESYESQTTVDDGFRLWAYTDADIEKCTRWAAKPPAWFHTDIEEHKAHSGSVKSKVRRKMGSVSKVRHKTGRGK